MTTVISGSAPSITFSDSTTQSTTAPSTSTFGFKNRIINGGMVIDQRNAGGSVTSVDSTYVLDRWKMAASPASKYSVQQLSSSPPTGFTNYLGVTSLSAYTVASSDYQGIQQRIEGYNFADLGWGTANAKTITISFWVQSSLTGTFGCSLYNASANRSYPFTYTISSPNTWEQKSITIAGDTSGTWTMGTSAGVTLTFGLGVGSTYSGTSGSWAGTLYFSATGGTSVVGTSGATFYITGVQLEVGTQATSFDFRDYGRELFLCQRYFCRLPEPNSSTVISLYTTANGANVIFGHSYPAPMRVSPTANNVLGSCNSGTYYLEGTSSLIYRAGATGTGSGAMSYSIGGTFSAEL